MFQWLRIRQVMPHIQGRLLDVGCGNNKLVKKYGNGVGYDLNSPDPEGTFDTITFVASLNYILPTDRRWMINYANNHLNKNGKIIVLCRRIFNGLSKEHVVDLFNVNWYLYYYQKVLPCNSLYVFKRKYKYPL